MRYADVIEKISTYKHHINKNFDHPIGSITLNHIIPYPNQEKIDAALVRDILLGNQAHIEVLKTTDCKLLFIFNYERRVMNFGTHYVSEQTFININQFCINQAAIKSNQG